MMTTLCCSTAREMKLIKTSTLHQWLYGGDTYYGQVYTDRLAFRVPRSVQELYVAIFALAGDS